MSEKKLLVDEESLDYEGLFNLLELYSIVDDFLKQKGYDKFEPLNEESVYPDGKNIHVKLTPMKWHTDYVKKSLKIEMQMHDIKEVETKIDKVTVKINQGKVKILFSAWLETDWEGRWEHKPFYYFIRTIFNKYIYRKHTHDFETEVIEDINDLRTKLGSFLNLYRFRKAI